MILFRTLLLSFFLSATTFAQSPEWEAPLHASLEKMAVTLTAASKPWPVPKRVFKVADYGSKTVPAYGFWIRHAEQIVFDRVTITPEKPAARLCFVPSADTSGIVFP